MNDIKIWKNDNPIANYKNVVGIFSHKDGSLEIVINGGNEYITIKREDYDWFRIV